LCFGSVTSCASTGPEDSCGQDRKQPHKLWHLPHFSAPTNEREFPVPNLPHCGERQLGATVVGAFSHQLIGKGRSGAILTNGIDLAKKDFAV
jgi:hypothetical protein